MATLSELKAQIKLLKEQVDQLQAIYDQFGNIEETPIGRVYVVEFKPEGVSVFLTELFWKVNEFNWRSTYFSGSKTTSEVINVLASASEIAWVKKVGNVNTLD